MTKENIILYDGVCILCDGFIGFVAKRDLKKKYKFTYLQSQTSKKLAKEYNFTISKNLNSVYLIREKKFYNKSSAILYVLKDLGGIYKIFSIFLILPEGFRNVFYDFVGNRRYKWFGKKSVCGTDIKEIKDRLIT